MGFINWRSTWRPPREFTFVTCKRVLEWFTRFSRRGMVYGIPRMTWPTYSIPYLSIRLCMFLHRNLYYKGNLLMYVSLPPTCHLDVGWTPHFGSKRYNQLFSISKSSSHTLLTEMFVLRTTCTGNVRCTTLAKVWQWFEAYRTWRIQNIKFIWGMERRGIVNLEWNSKT